MVQGLDVDPDERRRPADGEASGRFVLVGSLVIGCLRAIRIEWLGGGHHDPRVLRVMTGNSMGFHGFPSGG
ncbi:hypothetical protein [Actinomadura sp. 6N118]|uniref:hypothetical protein n=1 Tax=Actinomadura sp. 6N118 TaxID=3375151 RepID=UPI0037AB5D7E